MWKFETEKLGTDVKKRNGKNWNGDVCICISVYVYQKNFQ